MLFHITRNPAFYYYLLLIRYVERTSFWTCQSLERQLHTIGAKENADAAQRTSSPMMAKSDPSFWLGGAAAPDIWWPTAKESYLCSSTPDLSAVSVEQIFEEMNYFRGLFKLSARWDVNATLKAVQLPVYREMRPKDGAGIGKVHPESSSPSGHIVNTSSSYSFHMHHQSFKS